jgi:uncharacterized protein HemY
MKTWVQILIIVLLLAILITILQTGRYQILWRSDFPIVRMDKLTGQVWIKNSEGKWIKPRGSPHQ